MNSIYLIYIIRLVMGAVFIYASYSKILDPASFSENIHYYGVTSIYIENLISLILPWIELFIGIGLISGFKYEASVDLSIYMMILFIFLITQAYLRGKSIDCGCFFSDINFEDAATKRFDMLKRVLEDIVFMILLFTLKYNINKEKST